MQNIFAAKSRVKLFATKPQNSQSIFFLGKINTTIEWITFIFLLDKRKLRSCALC